MEKGQSSAASIMTLIILIALFMVLYLLLLPPADREALLGTQPTNIIDNVTSGAQTLLYEIPGKIIPDKEDKIEHSLDPINLFVKSEPTINLLADSIKVSNGAFGNQDQTIAFDVDNKDNLNKAFLVFSVKDQRGNLLISLNGNQIYNNRLNKGEQAVITLPINLLNKRNELKFSASSPGILFFLKNYYTLKDISLKEEFEKINSKESRVFSVSTTEKDNLKSSKLDYFIFCNSLQEPVTSLKIYLNDKLSTSTVISCGGGERGVDLDTDQIKEGQNELLFVIENGDFTISQLKVTNNLNQGIFKVYNFDIAKSDFKLIETNEKDVVLRMSFGDRGKQKKGQILINEDQISFDTTGDTFARDISKTVLQGTNLLRIVPDKEFDVNTLRITIE